MRYVAGVQVPVEEAQVVEAPNVLHGILHRGLEQLSRESSAVLGAVHPVPQREAAHVLAHRDPHPAPAVGGNIRELAVLADDGPLRFHGTRDDRHELRPGSHDTRRLHGLVDPAVHQALVLGDVVVDGPLPVARTPLAPVLDSLRTDELHLDGHRVRQVLGLAAANLPHARAHEYDAVGSSIHHLAQLVPQPKGHRHDLGQSATHLALALHLRLPQPEERSPPLAHPALATPSAILLVQLGDRIGICLLRHC